MSYLPSLQSVMTAGKTLLQGHDTNHFPTQPPKEIPKKYPTRAIAGGAVTAATVGYFGQTNRKHPVRPKNNDNTTMPNKTTVPNHNVEESNKKNDTTTKNKKTVEDKIFKSTNIDSTNNHQFFNTYINFLQNQTKLSQDDKCTKLCDAYVKRVKSFLDSENTIMKNYLKSKEEATKFVSTPDNTNKTACYKECIDEKNPYGF